MKELSRAVWWLSGGCQGAVKKNIKRKLQNIFEKSEQKCFQKREKKERERIKKDKRISTPSVTV